MSQIVVIVGSSGGIGRRFAEYFIANGGNVFGLSRCAPDIKNVNYTHIETDITQEADVLKACNYFRENKIFPNLVLNCSGISDQNLVLFSTLNSFQNTINVNLIGSYLINREFAKLLMVANAGTIINFSSIHTSTATVGSSAYAASKSGLETFTKVLANELSQTQVKIACIALSYVEKTGMAQHTSNEIQERVVNESESGAIISFEDVNQMVNQISKATKPLGSILFKIGI